MSIQLCRLEIMIDTNMTVTKLLEKLNKTYSIYGNLQIKVHVLRSLLSVGRGRLRHD